MNKNKNNLISFPYSHNVKREDCLENPLKNSYKSILDQLEKKLNTLKESEMDEFAKELHSRKQYLLDEIELYHN